MSAIEASYSEATASDREESTPLAQLSIELGHLYREDFHGDRSGLAAYFSRVAPWVTAARQAYALPGGHHRARISTCFLIDDYFAPFSTPVEVIPALCEAAESAGLVIDYIARESACAVADGVPLARLVENRLVPEPPASSDGSRPPVTELGWLSNGERSPLAAAEAMDGRASWQPPLQNSARHHSVFADVELWSETGGERLWSCAFLAAVWQLVRLGAVRHNGAAVTRARPHAIHSSDTWDGLPPILQLNSAAAPFAAYQTLSVLPSRFLLVEHAVRVILEQIAVDDRIWAKIQKRGEAEGFDLSAEVVDRISYVFDGRLSVQQ